MRYCLACGVIVAGGKFTFLGQVIKKANQKAGLVVSCDAAMTGMAVSNALLRDSKPVVVHVDIEAKMRVWIRDVTSLITTFSDKGDFDTAAAAKTTCDRLQWRKVVRETANEGLTNPELMFKFLGCRDKSGMP